MKQKTAVEWLVDKLKKGEFINNPDELIEQAKQMEKEQIEEAFYQGVDRESDHHGAGYLGKEDAEQYYTETYGK